jgi:aryl-alcohol dehydrogenase-like predicted oxidoreductase
MKYRLLGDSGIRVSEISLGTMAYGGAQYQFTDFPVKKDDAQKTIKKALELGINHIDCADIYGAYGNAEKIIAETIKDYNREEIILSSKLMMPMSRHELDRGLNRKHIVKSINRTLSNFETDYVDLYYAHRYDYFTQSLEKVIKSMNILIEQGKIRHWGTSNWSPAELERVHAICDKYGWEGPIVDQTRYNLLSRYNAEIALQYTLDGHKMGLVIYKILLEGIFAGVHSKEGTLSESKKEELQKILRNIPMTDELFTKIKNFDELAKSLDLTPSQLAYAFILQVENVSTALMSTRDPDRIEQNIVACDVELSNETKQEINMLFPPEYDGYAAYLQVKNSMIMNEDRVVGKITEEMMKF